MDMKKKNAPCCRMVNGKKVCRHSTAKDHHCTCGQNK